MKNLYTWEISGKIDDNEVIDIIFDKTLAKYLRKSGLSSIGKLRIGYRVFEKRSEIVFYEEN